MYEAIVFKGDSKTHDPLLDVDFISNCKDLKSKGYKITLYTYGMDALRLSEAIKYNLLDAIYLELLVPPEKYLKLTRMDYENVRAAYQMVKSFQAHDFIYNPNE